MDTIPSFFNISSLFAPLSRSVFINFNSPFDLTIDSSGNVYEVDTTNDRIQKFNSEGTFLTKWGTSGTENGQFSSPFGIAVDSSGNVYVTDVGNNRIQKFH